VPEVGLDRPRVLAGVGQRVAGRMAEHVGVNLERKASLLPGSLDHPVEAVAIERLAVALRDEHEV